MKTEEQKHEMINRLKLDKEALPETNIFGDNNWELIDIKIDIISGKKSYALHFSDLAKNSEDENYEEECRMESAAYQADDWLKGNIDDEEFIGDE